MPERLQFHVEPSKGWINDPNGLVYFKGQYHAFYQHYPYEPRWGQMHWGHAVSDDLLHWEELPVALWPDESYENSGGCFSGSAIVKDDVLYLFYTSVSHELGQTQSLAVSRDGRTFEKYAGNPIIPVSPLGSNNDFRDPKVTQIGGRYYMVCGAGQDGIGKVLLFVSDDLLHWEYENTILEGEQYGPAAECPDLFPLGDHYVLMISVMKPQPYSTVMLLGDFDGHTFTPIADRSIEAGPDFYAPQTFLDPHGRRILMGWLWHGERVRPADCPYLGALSIPRELTLSPDGAIKSFPVSEAAPLLTDTDEHVQVEGDTLRLLDGGALLAEYTPGPIRELHILRDTRTIEVFVNRGAFTATFWYRD